MRKVFRDKARLYYLVKDFENEAHYDTTQMNLYTWIYSDRKGEYEWQDKIPYNMEIVKMLFN